MELYDRRVVEPEEHLPLDEDFLQAIVCLELVPLQLLQSVELTRHQWLSEFELLFYALELNLEDGSIRAGADLRSRGEVEPRKPLRKWLDFL